MNSDINSFNIDQVFAVLRHDWVWKFFFDSDNEELDMLRHALRDFPPATAKRRIFTKYGIDDPQSPFAFDERFISFFVPSFSTGDITVGFAINECLRTSGPLMQRPRYLTRVVRDDNARTQLSIHVNDEKRIVEVWFHRLHSRTCREYVFATFSLPLFHIALQTLKHNPPLLRALLYSYTAAETRSCPDCQRPWNSNYCECSPVLRKKLHPRDAEADTHRVALFCGGYKATGTVQLWKAGMPTARARFSAGAVGILTHDAVRAKQLADWALNVAALRKIVSPIRSLPYDIRQTITSERETLRNSRSEQESKDHDEGESDSWDEDMIDTNKFHDLPESELDAIVPRGMNDVVPFENDRSENPRIAPRPREMSEIEAHMAFTSSLDERRRKLELRKARNRESAHRSNQRKKQALEQLRIDLGEIMKQKRVLMIREQQLREQNLALRKQMSSSN